MTKKADSNAKTQISQAQDKEVEQIRRRRRIGDDGRFDCQGTRQAATAKVKKDHRD